MEIKINNYRKIFSIQDEFSEMFPLLRLAFYDRSGKHRLGSKTVVKDDQKTIAECRKGYKAGLILIYQKMSIRKLKQAFNEGFGLGVDVFTKTGNTSLDRVPVQEGKALKIASAEIETLKSYNRYPLTSLSSTDS